MRIHPNAIAEQKRLLRQSRMEGAIGFALSLLLLGLFLYFALVFFVALGVTLAFATMPFLAKKQ